MSPFFLLVVVVVGVLALLVFANLSRRGSGRPEVGFPYGPQPALFTPAERSFLGALETAVGETYRIFGKVRLADVIKVNSGLSRSARQVAFNRISGKHLDFVLCDPTSLKVVAAIELDDKSHEAPSRKQRDGFVDAALSAAGIQVHHLSAKRSYSVHDLRDMIAPALPNTEEDQGQPPGSGYGRP